ncbi:MAG: hypothetical protein R3E12_11825 [Candidatus Eisenbacteria bacterium]
MSPSPDDDGRRSPRIAVHRKTLSNGLLALLVQRPGLPVVSLNLLLRSGLVRERRGEEGLAQLTTTLLSHGTRQRSDAARGGRRLLGAALGAHLPIATAMSPARRSGAAIEILA